MNPVRRLRLQVGLTQDLLAKAAGTGQSAISAYETGAISPTLATLERLAAAVGHSAVVTFEPVSPDEDSGTRAERPTEADPAALAGPHRDELWTL